MIMVTVRYPSGKVNYLSKVIGGRKIITEFIGPSGKVNYLSKVI